MAARPFSVTRAGSPLRRVVAAIVLSAIMIPAAAPAAPIVRAGDPSSDIPGISLTGPVAAGRLGGSIYDVVYRLDVAPGHVIAASLTGTVGTDFDLYLFDSTASTVVGTQGLLKKSTGPTSTESISWPSRAGGTYYLDLNGASAVEGDYRLAVQTVPDPTPPLVSITLGNGRPTTNLSTVPVSVTGSDDLSGVADMAFSADGSTYGEWIPYARSTSWTFPTGDGRKSLWVKVRNGVGLESVPAMGSVTIDTAPPIVAAIDPPPGTSVAGLRPAIRVTFSEPMDPSSWAELGLILQSALGDLILGGYSYDQATRTGTFVPAAPLSAGAAYIATVGDVTDVAGNRVSSFGSWTIVPFVATGLAVRADHPIVAVGGAAAIQLTMTGVPEGVPVDVESATRASGVFNPLTTLTVTGGHASLDITPAVNMTYRFSYAGAPGIAPAVAEVSILVRRSIGLVGRSSTTVAAGKVGRSVVLTARVAPGAAGVPVSFLLYRFDSAHRRWVYAGSHGKKTDSGGRASLPWTAASAGSYYWRVTVASTADFANNSSPIYRWSVTR